MKALTQREINHATCKDNTGFLSLSNVLQDNMITSPATQACCHCQSPNSNAYEESALKGHQGCVPIQSQSDFQFE